MVVTGRAFRLAFIALCLSGRVVLAQPLSNGLAQPDQLAGQPPTGTQDPFAAGNLDAPAGSPAPSMALDAGSPSPIMRFLLNGLGPESFGQGAMTLPDSHDAGPFATTGPDAGNAIAADMGNALASSVPLLGSYTGVVAPQAPGATVASAAGTAPACSDDFTERQLQAGGTYWTPQARSAVPVQFPAAVFTGNPLGSRDPVALGPTGHPVNLPDEGAAGSWCRPPPVPMSLSSPLVTRAFWIVVLFPTGVFVVFWLSRGLRIKAV